MIYSRLVKRTMRRLNQGLIFTASVLFQLLGVRALLTDLPSLLHPWKSGEAYGAFQASQVRGYFIGFPDHYVFRAEDQKGNQLEMYAIYIIETVILMILRVACICQSTKRPVDLI